MVRSISILFLLLFSSVAVFAEIQEIQIMGKKVTVCKSTSSNPTTFAIVSSPDIGQLKGSHNSTLNSVDVYRSTYEFDYSTYSPALDVKSVSITISPSGNPMGCTFSITSPSSAIAANASSFDNISSAGSLFSSLNYSGSNMPTSGSGLTEAVKNTIKNQGKLYLGAYSDNESQDSTQLLVNIYITVHYEQKYFVSAKAMTNFGGGYILVSGERKDHGQGFSRIEGEDVTLEAVDQDYGGYKRVWKSGANASKWEEKILKQDFNSVSYDRYFNLNMTMSRNGAEYKANYRKVFNVGFSVKSSNPSLQVPITLNGNNYINSIPPLEVIDGDQLSITVPTTIELDNIIYRVNGAGSGNTTIFTFNPSDHANIQIEYTGYADKSIAPHLTSTSNDHTKVTFGWTEYPNPNVSQYQIIRRAEHLKGGDDIKSLIATVPRGTTSYTDQYYYINNSGDYNLFYEVLPYFAPEGTYAHSLPEINMFAFVGSKSGYGEGGEVLNKKSEVAMNYEYNLSNYPNPFNPSTQVSYSLKENGRVQLQVFDILGNKVAELVNEYQPAGTYNVNFDGSNKPSGIYICTIKANNFTKTQKMLLLK